MQIYKFFNKKKNIMRAAISFKEDKKFKTIYCYGDIYPLGLGARLILYFNSEEKARELVSKGDIPYLVSDLDSFPSFGSSVELDSCPTECFNYIFKDNKWFITKWDQNEKKHDDWRVLRNII